MYSRTILLIFLLDVLQPKRIVHCIVHLKIRIEHNMRNKTTSIKVCTERYSPKSLSLLIISVHRMLLENIM